MPPLLLNLLKVLFLAVLYLFVARAIRVIWLDLAGPRARGSAPAPAKPTRAAARAATPAPPARSARARSGAGVGVLVVTEDGGQPRSYPVTGEAMTIGRADECQIVLGDGFVSQMHTKIFRKDGVWLVADLGSTNGTFLNRVKVGDPMPIHPGDEVRLGKTVVEVRAK